MKKRIYGIISIIILLVVIISVVFFFLGISDYRSDPSKEATESINFDMDGDGFYYQSIFLEKGDYNIWVKNCDPQVYVRDESGTIIEYASGGDIVYILDIKRVVDEDEYNRISNLYIREEGTYEVTVASIFYDEGWIYITPDLVTYNTYVYIIMGFIGIIGGIIAIMVCFIVFIIDVMRSTNSKKKE
jgi:hypothetical protein